jgi:hypothetical protein
VKLAVFQVLDPLRVRVHKPLDWDERYAQYLRRAGFLPLARLVNAGLPAMDGTLLTAMVDRWRTETHTFHLPCGEVGITLEDASMILGLQLDGRAVVAATNIAGWRDAAEALVGARPPDAPDDARDLRSSGPSIAWFQGTFSVCPPDAGDAQVEQYARAWLWHLLGAFLFPDGSGNTVSNMWLAILQEDWEQIGQYSWGSEVLAWLYRQLCEASRRSGRRSNLGGCAYLMQIWMWERFPVGRPDRDSPGVSSEHIVRNCGSFHAY